MLLTCRPCFPPHKYRSPHPQTSPDEYSRYGRLGFQICEKRQNTSNQGNSVIQRRFGQLTRQPLWVTCPWAGQSHLSSSAQWERGLLERHSGTSRSPLPAPPHFWAASQRWDALEGRTITNTIIIINTTVISLLLMVQSHTPSGSELFLQQE